ncbi:MAG: aldo/keto reductase [Fimbriimonadaceae bacterium]
MEFRTFGKHGWQVSPIGFGGAEIGYREVPQDTVNLMLNSALDLGINVFDTAECYMESEQKIGDAISHRRSEFYLFTKCGHSSGFDEPDWDPTMLRKQIDRSLSRLKTDHVDLILLHTCTQETLEQGEVIQVLQEAKHAGKTRLIGYSGDSHTAKFAVEMGVFDALQTSVNICDQECIDMVLPLAVERGMGVIAKRPVANVCWNLTAADTDRYGYPYWQRFQELQYETQNLFERALRFTLAQTVSVAIVGASSVSRFEPNLAIAMKGALPTGEVQAFRTRWGEIARPDWIGLT